MPLGLAILSCALAAGTCHASADPAAAAYAVRVTAPAGSVVRLSALDVPRGWTASFCTARVCSPGHVSLTVHARSATIQVSYIQTGARAEPLRRLHLIARTRANFAGARRSAVL